jgi:hypothetical protein
MAVIPNSSYLIYENSDNNPPGGSIPGSSINVSFYTYDGNVIDTIQHHFSSMSSRLDPVAAKPQPTTFAIKEWAGAYLAWLSFIFGMREGTPGTFVCFYDKNGNMIKCYRYDRDTQHLFLVGIEGYYPHLESSSTIVFDPANPSSIPADFPLDLSIVVQQS